MVEIDSRTRRDGRERLFRDLLVGATALFAGLYLVLSLGWPVIHDLRVLLYEGYLLADLGLVPYRDFFDVNAPGTLLLFSALHRITAGSQPVLRMIDLAVLAAIAVATFMALRRHGARTGILAVSCFTAHYLSIGPENSLQREYLCMLPLAVSIALIFSRDPENDARQNSRFFLCGLLAGGVFTLKPPLVLCWLPLLVYAACWPAGFARFKTAAKMASFFLAGALVPLLLVAWWLHHHEAALPFLDMARNYYPLYTRIDGLGIVHPGGGQDLLERYGWKTAPLLVRPLTIAAMLGVMAASSWKEGRLKAQGATLAGLAFCALLYVPVSGKFWLYHQIPLFYALSLFAGLAVSRCLEPAYWRSRWKTPVLIGALLASWPLDAYRGHLGWRYNVLIDRENRQVKPMADYLRDHTTTADTIQPLDTTSGAEHALYLARRPFYGHFLYDFHFYHHSSDPYIADLRRQFLAQFNGGRPTVLLQCDAWRPVAVSGDDAFPEFEEILQRDFVEVVQAQQCRVLRRRG